MSEEIKIDKGEEYTKFTITTPLITKDEEIILDNYLHDIVKDMNNCYVHDKELALMQEVTRRLEQENQKLKEELELNDCKRIYNQFVNYKNWYFEYVDKCDKYKLILDKIILQLKLERKLALSLNKPYTVSVIDKLLDKVKE